MTKGDNEIFNISTGKPTTVNGLFTIMKSIFVSDLEVFHEKDRTGEIRDSYSSNDKAMKFLNWCNEYDLEQGIRNTCLYYGSV